MIDLILVLDYGTTALKASVYDSSFRQVGLVRREWTYLYPREDHIEYPAHQYWTQTVQAVRDLLAKTGVSAGIEAIGITGQAETMILLDDDNLPLGNAILWLDTRAKEECLEFQRNIPQKKIYSVTGNTGFDPIMPLLKLKWIIKHEPERYQNTKKVLLLKEYIVYCLTGRIIGEYSSQSCSGYFDIVKCDWDAELLKESGIAQDKLPPLFESRYIAGILTTHAGIELGLASNNVKIINGLLDQCAAAIGAGSLNENLITETTGTVLAISALLNRFDSREMNLTVFRHALPGKYLALPNCSTAGILLKWFRDEFLRSGISYDDISYRILERGKIDSGLILLPHFAGYQSPISNPLATGVLYGLSLDTTIWDLPHAIMEGVSFLLRENLEALEKAGFNTNHIVSMGGAASSALWMSIKSNICNRPMMTLEDEEATSKGCAFNAALSLGWIDEVDIPKYIHFGRTYHPDPAFTERYNEIYRRYTLLNRQLGFTDSEIF